MLSNKPLKIAYWRGQAVAVAANRPYPNRHIVNGKGETFDGPGEVYSKNRKEPLQMREIYDWVDRIASFLGYAPGMPDNIYAWFADGFWARVGELEPEFVLFHVKKLGSPTLVTVKRDFPVDLLTGDIVPRRGVDR